MDFSTDLLIIGGGVVGCALAREMSRYRLSAVLLERAGDVAEGASKANSGIIHAGFDAVPGSLKAKYNVEGARMLPALCEALGVPWRRNGALVIGFSEEDRAVLAELLERGRRNGVEGLRILERDEVLALEPNLNPEVCCALEAPTGAIVSPYELTFALADDAALNGVDFRLDTAVRRISRREDGTFRVETNRGDWTCRAVVNCAGASAAELHNQLSPRKLENVPRRGQYYLLDRPETLPFQHTVFQCPSRMGKGVLVTPTVHGNVLLGPSAEDIDDPLDTATTQDGLDFVLSRARRTWPAVSTRSNITNFSGIRAHEPGDDFVVGPTEGCPHAWEAVGIESPGLSSAPVIARALAEQIAAELSLEEKAERVPFRAPSVPFRDLSPEARAAAVKADPRQGVVVCRCEVVTEAEIREAIRRPVGARSIDAVKRRTRAGMGRCQGGFCSPRVAAILAEELGLPLTEITKNGGESFLLTGTLREEAERSVRE